MPDGNGVSFFLQPGFNDDQGRRWLVVRLDVGQDIVWDMLLNPTARRSTISREAFDDLASKGLVPTGSHRRVTLQHLRIDGQRVPDVDAYLSVAVSRRGVGGILGLDFFEQFTAIQWYPRTHRVVLIDQ